MELRNKNVLVTGGAGFIGSNLVLDLQERGHRVIVLDNLSSGKRENLNGFHGNFIEADVSKAIKLNNRFDAIFHMAAITDPRHSNEQKTYNENIKGFWLMQNLAEDSGSKFIYASTANLYGNGPIPMKENQKKDIITTYGESKLEMDDLVFILLKEMHIVGLRYFNVFGPGESSKGRSASMIYHLYKTMKAGKRPRLFKFGEQKRDHIYVKDVVDATIKALNAPSGIYNVGTGVATSFNDLTKLMNEILGTNLETEYFDMPYDPLTYQANTQADTELTKEKLRFKARFSLKEGMKDYFNLLDAEERRNL